MEVTAGPWMGLLLGMILFVSCNHLPPNPNADTSAISPNAEYFAAGRNLHSDHMMSEREVKGRKGAPVESGIQETELKLNASTDSAVNIDQHNASSTFNREELKHINVGEHQQSSTSSYNMKSDQNSSSTVSAVLLHPKYNDTASAVNLNSTSVPKKKGKPGLTYDEDDLPRDANGKPILTKENLVSAGPAFDYVVPIVIAMLAIPFVAVIGAFLYKKGRDFWDRRHYRRMDFLIDGMYNDS